MPRTGCFNAGVGAKASVLTKYIRPPQPVPDDKHRTDVVVLSRYEVGKGETKGVRYTFQRTSGSGPVLNASMMYVRITEQGREHDLFKEDVVDKDNGWSKSKARKLLYSDILSGFAKNRWNGNTKRGR